MMVISNWKKTLPIIGIAIFIFLIWKIDINKIWIVLREINVRYLLILPFTIITILVFQTVKWKLILIKQGFNIGFKRLFKITWIGFFYAAITPGRVGNLIKISYLKNKTGNSIMECSSSVIIDKFLDTIVLFIFSLIGSYILIGKFAGLFIGISILLVALFIFFLFFYNKERTKSFLKFFFRAFMTERLKNKFREPFKDFFKFLPRKKWLIFPFKLTLLTWIMIYTQSFIIAKSLDIHIDFKIFIFLLPLGTVAGLLPITISGLGTREAVLVSVFLLYGIAPEKVVSMSLISLILCSYIPAIAGWLMTFQNSK